MSTEELCLWSIPVGILLIPRGCSYTGVASVTFRRVYRQ